MYTEITNAAAENKCPEGKGQLPGRCAAMAFPFVAMQGQDPKRYDHPGDLSSMLITDFMMAETGISHHHVNEAVKPADWSGVISGREICLLFKAALYDALSFIG